MFQTTNQPLVNAKVTEKKIPSKQQDTTNRSGGFGEFCRAILTLAW
jgi:hypothetical protein